MKVIDLETLGEGGIEIDGVRDGIQNGGIITAVGDVNGDGLADFSVTSGFWNRNNPNYDMVFFGGGALDPVLGPDACDGEHGFTITPQWSNYSNAIGLTAAGDINGDGADDFGLGGYHRGLVVYGDPDRTAAHLELPTQTDSYGALLDASTWVAAGDVNGDGFDDILSSAYTGYYTHRVALTFGGPTGVGAKVVISDSSGSDAGDFVRSVGDVNGDGFDDIGVQSYTPSRAQGTAIIFGSADFGPVDLAHLTPEQGFVQHGSASAAGDVNGDGYGDFIVQNGVVIFGHAGPFTNTEFDAINGANGFAVKLGNTYMPLTAVGDVNGDGFDDLACGDSLDSDGGDKAGAVYIIYGHAKGFHAKLKIDSLGEGGGLKIIGALPNNQIKFVTGLGDVNGDGIGDIGISDPNHLAADTGLDSGAAYVIYGLQPDSAVKRVDGDVGHVLAGGAFNDKLYGEGGDDTLWGNDGADRLEGGEGGDTLHGGRGADLVRGDAGADELYGGRDNDHVIGGDGDDTLSGGQGADRLSGGEGSDTFAFGALADSTVQAHDFISDLSAADVIDLSAIDAVASQAGDQAFHLVGAFTHKAGELTLKFDSSIGVTLLQGDVDGDGVADLSVWIAGDKHQFANFVL
jgi:Ca2+-binding RTX toxin-like protein